MKLTKELAEIARKKYIEQVRLSEAETLKWAEYLTSVDRAIKRKAYKDATPEQRIILRQQTNFAFSAACQRAIDAAIRDRAFLETIFKMIIQGAAASLIAEIEEI